MWFFNTNIFIVVDQWKHDLRNYIKNKYVTSYENNCKLTTWCKNKEKS